MAPPDIIQEEFRKRKPAAIIVIILCIAALAGTGYLYFTSNVEVSFTGCIATDALDQRETCSQLTGDLKDGVLTGTPFTQNVDSSPEDYQFYTFSVRIDNRSFLRAEQAEIQVTPMSGDVLQMGSQYVCDVPARTSTDLSATILTVKTAHNVRELTVSYYIWGIPFLVRLTTGG